MDIVERFSEMVRGKGLRVVFPEGEDPRIIRAARLLKNVELAAPVLLGDPQRVQQAAAGVSVDLNDIQVIDPVSSPLLPEYTARYAAERSLKEGVALRLVRRPLFFGGMMVKTGSADTMVGGASQTTASVIQAGALTVGLAQGIAVPSSFFLMVIPTFEGQDNRAFVFADCAVNIDPTADELADIALASAASATKLLGERPRVAMLSFSTLGSAQHADVDKVRDALAIAQAKDPNLDIDGELQADAAISGRVAGKKVMRPSGVAGKANVLIFPDLNSGNIAYKLTQYMAGARAIGPMLQGFAKPISDLSRGATTDDIVAATVITLALT